ncbi:HlyD family efflux transporter periplasmic adaptor subunit [Metabacillus malikii]|uniref:HlyD family secretion protein n=1 Tax=Metabacillus malikii TaxID=1504265 RepID=A0ABT9ZFS5_9BACI|nr:HlyD family efflux transporter periplasmic adaptor subunit [Metabacillus malikii]MDQ0230734.1 HlyD family secretion protein [Metabacillus malikii]
MRKNIIDMEEWSASKDILNAKPNRIVPLFLVILLLIIATLLAWSYFGKIDEYTKAVGIVRPGEDIRTISGKPGEIEKVYVEEGQIVKENEPLLTINNDEVTIKKEELDTQIATLKEEVELLQTYKEGIDSNRNTINGEGELVEKYRNELDKYLLKQESLQKEITLLQEMENESKSYVSNQHLKVDSELADLTNEVNQYKNLEQKIMNNKDISINNDSSAYILYKRYLADLDKIENEYEQQMTTLQNQAEESEKALQVQEGLQDVAVNQSSEISFEDLEKQKNEAIHQLKTDYQTQILSSINSLDSEKRSIELNSYQPSNSQYGVQISQVLSSKMEYEKETIAQINDSIQQLENQLVTLQSQAKLNNETEKSSEILAPSTGIVELGQPISEGDVLQGGEKILSIIPEKNKVYKIKLSIPSSEIGKIKIGDAINFRFDSLSKDENKRITGKVTYISPDIVVDSETNANYFVAESTIPMKSLQEKGISIKIGMSCEAHIVYDSKRILHFILEKLSFM